MEMEEAKEVWMEKEKQKPKYNGRQIGELSTGKEEKGNKSQKQRIMEV